MQSIDVEEWINSFTEGHKFGGERNIYEPNKNLEIRLSDNVVVEMRDGKVFEFVAGSRVGIFRMYKNSGHKIVATVFRTDNCVVIYQGGSAVIRQNVVEYVVQSRSLMAIA